MSDDPTPVYITPSDDPDEPTVGELIEAEERGEVVDLEGQYTLRGLALDMSSAVSRWLRRWRRERSREAGRKGQRGKTCPEVFEATVKMLRANPEAAVEDLWAAFPDHDAGDGPYCEIDEDGRERLVEHVTTRTDGETVEKRCSITRRTFGGYVTDARAALAGD